MIKLGASLTNQSTGGFILKNLLAVSCLAFKQFSMYNKSLNSSQFIRSEAIIASY